MAIQSVKISDVKSNPNNPRLIKNDKFEKLVQSLKDFPEMAKVRPIVVNQDFVVLGGNMRLKAMKEAGWKEVSVQVVDWSEDQQKEFIIKDNVGFGEWEWDMLANEWEAEDLDKWGLDVPKFEDSQQEDLSDKITDTYRIEIVCESEQDQQKAYNDLIEQGYECRLLTL
jgi:ParB-like chromosome segregation protein Spo0J